MGVVTAYLIECVRPEGAARLYLLPIEKRFGRGLWTAEPQEAERFRTREAAEGAAWKIRELSPRELLVSEHGFEQSGPELPQ